MRKKDFTFEIMPNVDLAVGEDMPVVLILFEIFHIALFKEYAHATKVKDYHQSYSTELYKYASYAEPKDGSKVIIVGEILAINQCYLKVPFSPSLNWVQHWQNCSM